VLAESVNDSIQAKNLQTFTSPKIPHLAELGTELPWESTSGEFCYLSVTSTSRTAEYLHPWRTWAAIDLKGTFRTQVASGKSVVTLITIIASSE